jgi:hypothetical protein
MFFCVFSWPPDEKTCFLFSPAPGQVLALAHTYLTERQPAWPCPLLTMQMMTARRRCRVATTAAAILSMTPWMHSTRRRQPLMREKASSTHTHTRTTTTACSLSPHTFPCLPIAQPPRVCRRALGGCCPLQPATSASIHTSMMRPWAQQPPTPPPRGHHPLSGPSSCRFSRRFDFSHTHAHTDGLPATHTCTADASTRAAAQVLPGQA